MKWRSIILPVLIVIILGGLASFVTFLYLSQYPALVASDEDAYNILRDVIMIVIAVLTLFTAILIAVISWALRNILLRDLRSELQSHIDERTNVLFCNLHKKVGYLFGRLFERDMKDDILIQHAIEEEEEAIRCVNMLDEKKYWMLRIESINDYLMALAERGEVGDTNEAYKRSCELERLLKKHHNEIELPRKQNWEETVHFVRARLPRTNTDDREKAIRAFYTLEDNPRFEIWKERWIYLELIPNDTSPDKSS